MGDILDTGNFSKGIITDTIGTSDSATEIVDGIVERTGEVRSRGQKTLTATLRDISADMASNFAGGNWGKGAVFHDEAVDVFAQAAFNEHGIWLVGKNETPSDHHWIHSGGVRPSIPRNETGGFFGGRQDPLDVHTCRGGGASMTEVNHGLMSGSGGRHFVGGTDESDADSVNISYAGIYGGFVGPDQTGGQGVSIYELDGTNKVTLISGPPPTSSLFPDPAGLFIAFLNAPGITPHDENNVLNATTWVELNFSLLYGTTTVTNVTTPGLTPVEGVDYLLEEDTGVAGVGRIRRVSGSTQIVSGDNVKVNYRSKQGTDPDGGLDVKDVYYRIVSSSGDNFYLDRNAPTCRTVVHDVARVISPADPLEVGVERSKYFESHAGRVHSAGSYLNFDVGNGTTVGGSRMRHSGTSIDEVRVANSLASVTTEHVWYEDAFIDVFDNVGGAITGLHSIGGNLLIVKETALGIMRGQVQTKKLNPSTASIDVVSTDVGCPDDHAHDKSRLGIVLANKEGLWAFDGTSLSNLVDDKVEVLWKEMFGNFLSAKVDVASVGNRVFVNQEGSNEYLVYHIDHRHFTRQTTLECAAVFRAGDRDQALHEGSPNRLVDFASDYNYTTGTDVHDAAHPQMVIETPHMPGAESPFFSGRPDELFLSGYSTGDMSVNLIHGRTEEELEADPDLEYKFEVQAYDDTQRIPVEGVKSRPAFRLKIEQDTPGTDSRLYGVGIDIERDTVYGH